jgi:MoaA/NifB/PqqE/SkfB family radical SAM enzyme
MFMHLNFVTSEMAAVHNSLFGHICRATPLGVGVCTPVAVDVAVLSDQILHLRRHHRIWKTLFQPDLSTEAELDIYYRQPQRFLHRKRCFMPWQTALIMPDGGVIVRNRCYHVVFGNIFEQDLVTIWNNQAYRAFRTALKQAGAFPACSRCYGAFP